MNIKELKRLGFETLDENEIEIIKKYKLMYSIIKFEHQSKEYKHENNERNMIALNLNKEDINENMSETIISLLAEEKEKIDEIREKNQDKMDMLVEKIIMNLSLMFDKEDTDELACARIFQYVIKSIKYSEDLLNYETVIPFATDYQFSCYEGIPAGKNFEDILVTKTGTSFEIANLMTYLGRIFDLNIKTIVAVKDGKAFYINTFEKDGVISYMDPTSAILGKSIDNCFLVSKSQLKKNDKKNSVKLNSRYEQMEEGKNIKVDMRRASSVEKAISRERNMLATLTPEDIEKTARK